MDFRDTTFAPLGKARDYNRCPGNHKASSSDPFKLMAMIAVSLAPKCSVSHQNTACCGHGIADTVNFYYLNRHCFPAPARSCVLGLASVISPKQGLTKMREPAWALEAISIPFHPSGS